MAESVKHLYNYNRNVRHFMSKESFMVCREVSRKCSIERYDYFSEQAIDRKREFEAPISICK